MKGAQMSVMCQRQLREVTKTMVEVKILCLRTLIEKKWD